MKIIFTLALCFSILNVYSQTETAGTTNDTFRQDTLITITANPDSGFAYDYLLFIPKGTVKDKKNWLLVEPNNTGFTSDSIEKHREAAIVLATKSSIGNNISTELKVPMLVPIFPRPKSKALVYTHALDRDVMMLEKEDFVRPDLQLIAMMDDARSKLLQLGIQVEEKVLMSGFSASGSFVNRFAFLHPERIKALSAGGLNGILMLPRKEMNGYQLNYPLGTNDLQEFTGRKTDLEAYKKIPQLIFMGALDENDAVPNDDAYDDAEREVIFATVGKQMQPDRWERCQKIYKEEGVNALFRTYEGVGHGTTGMVNLEVIRFFQEQMKK